MGNNFKFAVYKRPKGKPVDWLPEFTTDKIMFSGGYKYQLRVDYKCRIDIHLDADIRDDFIWLTKDGRLTVFKGYAWDGPSGPAIDTPNFMRGSLMHDVLYQLMRRKKISIAFRPMADDILQRACREDGMTRFRAWYVRKSMNYKIARASATAKNKKKIYITP